MTPTSPKVLFLNRSYWPDVEATGQLLTELCSDLAAAYDVTVIAGRPNHAAAKLGRGGFHHEDHQGVHIVRVGSRTFDKRSLLSRAVGLLSYLALASWAAFRQPRPDVIVVETDPPLLGALGALLKLWHRSRLVFYLQDLYPEVGLALGKLRPGLLTWLLRQATQVGLARADRIVVLGEDMKKRVLARGIPADKIDLVPNWTDTAAVRPVEARDTLRGEWGLNGQFVAMYSGNLGLSQGLDAVLEAARRLRTDPILFLFVGEGAAKAGLVERAREWGLDNVRFLTYQPKDRLGASLGTADVHLIGLQRGLAGCIVPSKLYGILAAGKPYVAAVDDDSEVAHVTRAHDTGFLVPPDDPQALVEALRRCLRDRDGLPAMGRRGRQLAEEEYDRARSVARFARVLERCLPASRRAHLQASPAGGA